MARRFNKTNADYLYADSATFGLPATGFPRAISIWFRVSSASGVTEIYAHNVAADNQWSRIYLSGTSCLLSHKGNDNPTPLTVTLGTITLNTWHHVYAYFGSTTTFRGRLDGGTLQSNGGFSGSYSAYTEMNVGNRASGQLGMDGDIGEFAVWNLDLPNDIQILLSKGQTAFGIYPDNLKAFYNMQSGFEGAGGYEHNLAPTGDPFHYLNPTTEANIDKVDGSPTTPVLYNMTSPPMLTESAAVLSFTGIPSAEAFGTLQVNQSIELPSIESEEAFGDFQVDQKVDFTGIASEEAFGNLYITQGQTLVFTGIPSEEVIGALSVNRGIVDLNFFAIPSEEAFGTLTVTPALHDITLEGIPTEEAFGTFSISTILQMQGIPSEEAFGDMSIETGSVNIAFTGIDTEEDFGDFTTEYGNINIGMQGIPSEEAFGDPVISAGGIVVQIPSIDSEEAFGTLQIERGAVDISFTGITTEEAFGDLAIITSGVSVTFDGIDSEEAFGTLAISTGGINVSMEGVPTEEAFGALTVSPEGVQISFDGISSEESFGDPVISPQGVSIGFTGIDSEEAFGAFDLGLNVTFTGIPSEEAFGDIDIDTGNVNVSFTGIDSEEAFGDPIVRHVLIVEFPSILSEEAFGTPSFTHKYVNQFMQIMEEDLDAIFDEQDEFSSPHIIEHQSGLSYEFPGIFDNEHYLQDNGLSAPVVSRQPMVTCKDRFREKPTVGDRYIHDGVRYEILTYEPDGTGVAVLMLKKERTNHD